MKYLSIIKARLDQVEMRFRRGSKSYNLARWFVNQNRLIHESERGPIASEFGLARGTVNGIITKLGEMGCYGDTAPTPIIPSKEDPPKQIIAGPTDPTHPSQTESSHAEHTSQPDSPKSSQDYARVNVCALKRGLKRICKPTTRQVNSETGT